MAFDRKLEADKIDGFNLFSAFVSIPLFVLGGILGGEKTSTFNKDESDSLSHHHEGTSDHAENDISSDINSDCGFRVVGAECTTRYNQRRQRTQTTIIPHCHTQSSSEPIPASSHHLPGIKRSKKMSWSDESGLPLVYENCESISRNEQSSSPYSSAAGSFQKPTKSAMRKSRATIRHESRELPDYKGGATIRSPSRYIPNMNPRTAGNGLIIPTRPYGRHGSADNKLIGSNSAEMSPQWGWYINTTPPTPELYHSTSSSQSFAHSYAPQKQQTIKDGNSNNVIQKVSGRPTNEVFQNLKNSTKSNTMGGWTSIPI